MFARFKISIAIAVCLMGGFTAAPAQPPAASPWKRPESTKAFLASLGLKLDEIKDGQELNDQQIELFLRVLSRFQQLPLATTANWIKPPLAVREIAANPAEHRGELYQFKGVLRSQERIDLPKELAERFDTPSLYKLWISTDYDSDKAPSHPGAPGGARIEVWTPHIPVALADYRGQEPFQIEADPPVIYARVQAIFLAMVKDQPQEKAGPDYPVFVAPRLEWLPEQAADFPSLTPSLAALGQAGFDISLLDVVKKETSKRLTPEVTEPFYQLLAAQSNVDQKSLASAPLELAKLIAAPNDFTGEAIDLDAIARRVVEVPIENAADRKRLKLDRYYQVDLVLQKPTRTFVKDKDGRQREIEQPNFPLTLCVTQPPEGLPLGQEIRAPIRAKAFFFKLWAYESKFATAHVDGALQVSPLFIGRRLEVVEVPPPSTASFGWLIGGAIAVLLALALWGYLLLRADDARQSHLRRES